MSKCVFVGAPETIDSQKLEQCKNGLKKIIYRLVVKHWTMSFTYTWHTQ